ncbi:hypothetical protein [Kineosporia sp. NBRC 101731]|uniref:hypothetical protein n=1 Tax=Kineosporia sp. NBRC 101731 TaxID=3032199 RepID=UPI002554433D|nr:hypothetical protein [Kineosporia sp. NBRC 101731]
MSMPAHPEDDLLADLAADVLPIDVARQVEGHVMGCARCSAVLSSAEGIRSLIRQAPPETMPPQVMARLEQALAMARGGQVSQPLPQSQPQTRRGATGPMRRDVHGGNTGPQQQHPTGPQRQRPTGPQPQQSPPQHHTGPQPVRRDRSQPAPNTSSFTVRPLNLPTSNDSPAFPAGDATILQPAVRDNGPDPELTQPVRKRRGARAVQGPDTGSMTRTMRPVRDRAPGKLTRMENSTQAVRVRRQALEEQKAEEPSRWPRIPAGLVAAVVLVLALAGGGTAWMLKGRGSDGDSSSASTTASGPLLASVQETGTKYQRAGLKKQIDSLVTTPVTASSGAAEDGDTTMSARSEGEPETGEMPGASDSSTSGDSADTGDTADNGDLLKDPEALEKCLQAIDQKDAQPVAVDLATYNGREAALIVLPGASGGYDVWIVARTCQPGDDGTIDVVEVQS